MTLRLAPIFVNDDRVALQGEKRPSVARIVMATGQAPEEVQVVRLAGPADVEGKVLQPDDVIDRSGASEPVYLRCVAAKRPARPRWKGDRLAAGAPGAPGAAGASGAAATIPGASASWPSQELGSGGLGGGANIGSRGEMPRTRLDRDAVRTGKTLPQARKEEGARSGQRVKRGQWAERGQQAERGQAPQ